MFVPVPRVGEGSLETVQNISVNELVSMCPFNKGTKRTVEDVELAKVQGRDTTRVGQEQAGECVQQRTGHFHDCPMPPVADESNVAESSWSSPRVSWR